jgi:hypothetical protein
LYLFIVTTQQDAFTHNKDHKIYWLRHYATSRKVMGSRSDEANFEIYVILPATLGPEVHSASNRNEYQKHKNYVPGE